MSDQLTRIVRDRDFFGDATLKHVLSRLAADADDDFRVAISVETLADDCALAPNTIRRVIRDTERIGILELEERERGPWPRRYRFDIEQLIYGFALTTAGARREAERERRGAARSSAPNSPTMAPWRP